jgi:hypothetical protein
VNVVGQFWYCVSNALCGHGVGSVCFQGSKQTVISYALDVNLSVGGLCGVNGKWSFTMRESIVQKVKF